LIKRIIFQVVISEGCEPKDWSNDAENPALSYRNKLHSKLY